MATGYYADPAGYGGRIPLNLTFHSYFSPLEWNNFILILPIQLVQSVVVAALLKDKLQEEPCAVMVGQLTLKPKIKMKPWENGLADSERICLSKTF